MRSLLALLLLATLPARAQPTAEARALIDSVLAAPDEVILASMDPDMPAARQDAAGRCIAPCLDGIPELGRTRLPEAAEQRVVLDELQAWVQAPAPEYYAGCFNPRHAAIVRSGKRELTFVVCYECESTRVYEGSSTRTLAMLYRAGHGHAWNQLLRQHGVALPPPSAAEAAPAWRWGE